MDCYIPEWMIIIGILFMTAETLLFRFSTVCAFFRRIYHWLITGVLIVCFYCTN